METLHKVAILCTRDSSQLLVFHHDSGGVQVPAGTVEPGEDPGAAAIRELAEETGIAVDSVTHLFSTEERLEADEMVVVRDVPLLSVPEPTAPALAPSVWRSWVRVIDHGGTFAKVVLEEWDLDANPPRRKRTTEGFISTAALKPSQYRHVFHTLARLEVRDSWEVRAEHRYIFRCYWAPLNDPGLIDQQQRWVHRALPRLQRLFSPRTG